MAGWKSVSEPAALASAVWRSCHCALFLQHEIGQTLVEDELLTLRSGIAAGNINLVHLLSHSGNSRVILTGPGVQEVGRCAALAESGETLVSSDAWTYVAEHAKGRQMVEWARATPRHWHATTTGGRGLTNLVRWSRSGELPTHHRTLAARLVAITMACRAAHGHNVFYQDHRPRTPG